MDQSEGEGPNKHIPTPFVLQSGSLIVNPLGTKNLVHNIETSY